MDKTKFVEFCKLLVGKQVNYVTVADVVIEGICPHVRHYWGTDVLLALMAEMERCPVCLTHEAPVAMYWRSVWLVELVVHRNERGQKNYSLWYEAANAGGYMCIGGVTDDEFLHMANVLGVEVKAYDSLHTPLPI